LLVINGGVVGREFRVTEYQKNETDFPVQSLLGDKWIKLMQLNQEIMTHFGKAAGYV